MRQSDGSENQTPQQQACMKAAYFTHYSPTNIQHHI